MKKTVLFLSTLLLFMGGCSEEFSINEQETSLLDVITFTVGMPNQTTRLALEQSDRNVVAKWEAGDKLDLYIVYGDKNEKQTVDMKNISGDGKTAQFDLVLPEGDYTEFDLYGVFGGEGLSDSDNTKALLPVSKASTNLDGLGNELMLKFSETGINRENPDLTLSLENVGSLFNINIENTGSSNWNNIKKVELVSHKTIGAHFNQGGATYDILTGELAGTTTDSNVFSFELETPVNLGASQSLDVWAWFVPVEDKNWPAMQLRVVDASGFELAKTPIYQPSKANPTPSGKAFYINATWDGFLLSHTKLQEPRITFTTLREVGSSIDLNIRNGGGTIWLDLNNDAIMDDGEEFSAFDTRVKFTTVGQTMTIYGNAVRPNFIGAGPTAGVDYRCDVSHIDLSNAYPGIEYLTLPHNYLTEIDFTGIENSITQLNLSYSYRLGELDISSLDALTFFNGAYCSATPWTSIKLPQSENLATIMVLSSKMSADAITGIIEEMYDRTGLAKGNLRILENAAARRDLQNEVTTEHFTAAAAKNWEIQILDGSYKAATPGNYGPNYGPNI